ncbi:MAG: tetraacyldisaccharide 4'-kinase [Planctomycetes bacterium]|nr:tetraacyldisaccharide 4'-kinase [Planctomycetota bacterium]
MSEQGLYRRIIAGQTGAWSAPVRALLRAGELIYRTGVERRNRRYDRHGPRSVLPVPVISVGNLTVGGTGKTPLVIDLVQRLEQMGFSPAVVSRGYKSPVDEPNDEERLIRKRCPSVVYAADADRTRAAEWACDTQGADVIVLDDAFQHRRLGRTLDIVLVDATCPFGYNHLLPRGLLREPPSGLARAGLIVLTRCSQVSPAELDRVEAKIRRLNGGAPLIRCDHRVTGVERLDGRPADQELAGKRAILLAGIARPSAFEATVSAMGVRVVGHRWWPDHHRYRSRDVDRLMKTARFAPHDVLITTEKDAVKLADLGTFDHVPLYVVKISIDFLQDGSTMIQHVLDTKLRPNVAS